MMVTAEAELISPISTVAPSWSSMRCALVAAVAGLTESSEMISIWPSHDSAGFVDFLLGHAHAQLGVGAERTEESGQWREVADFDLVRLRADDRRKAERKRAGQCGAAL